jgi:hypothetical protein
MVVRPSNREIANQPVVAYVARPSAAEWDTLFLTTATSGLNNHGSRAFMLNAPLAKILEFKRDLAEEVFGRTHRARRRDSSPCA